MPTKTQELRFQPMQNTLARSVLPDGTIYRMVNATVENGILGARAGFGQYPKRNSTPSAWTNTDVCYGFGYGRYKTYEYYVAVIHPTGATNARLYAYSLASGTWATVTNDDWMERTKSRWNFATFDKYIYGVNATDGLWRFDMSIGAATNGWLFQEITQTSIVTPASTASLAEPPYGRRAWDAANDTEAVQASGTGYDYATTVIAATGEWTLGGWVNRGSPLKTAGWFCADIGGAGGVDFSQSRYVSAVVDITNPTLDAAGGSREGENPKILTAGAEYQCFISDDATAPFGTWTDSKWAECKVFVTPTTYLTGPERVTGVRVDIDLDYSQKAANPPDLTAITTFALKIPVESGNAFDLTMQPLDLGGVFLNKPTQDDYLSNGGDNPAGQFGNTAQDLEYLVQFYHNGTNAESAPTKYILKKADGWGASLNDSLPLGAGVKFDLPAPSGSYNRTRLWRKRRSASGNWYCLNEVSVATTVYDYYVDASGDPVTWPTTVTPRVEGYRFGSVVSQDISPDCVTVWKQHMVLGADNLVYFSEANKVGSYYFAPDDERNPSKGTIDTTDTTLGRTLYMSNDRSDSCLGFVSKDILYAVGYRGVYAFIGDSAITGSGFRRLPGSYGAISATAIAEYRDGVIVGSQSGLWYHEASRALAASNDFSTARVEELTSGVRTSWRWLLTTNPDNDLVVCEDGEGGILCIRGSRYMYLNPSGQWEEGKLNEDALLDGDPDGGDDGGGDVKVTPPGDGGEDIGVEDPIDGDPGNGSEICYSDSGLFTITQTWGTVSATETGAGSISGNWTTTGAFTGAKGIQAGAGPCAGPGTFANTLAASATNTITITYIGGNPKPTHVYVQVVSSVSSAVEWDFAQVPGTITETGTCTASDGMGTSSTTNTTTFTRTATCAGTRVYRLKVNSSTGVATLPISPSISVDASLVLTGSDTVRQDTGCSATYTVTIMPCGSTLSRSG